MEIPGQTSRPHRMSATVCVHLRFQKMFPGFFNQLENILADFRRFFPVIFAGAALAAIDTFAYSRLINRA